MTSYRAGVASGGGVIRGTVGEDILVLPNMHPRHVQQALDSRGVVAEVGGQLAHMAVVCREFSRTLMVLPDACEILTPGMVVTLDPRRCEIRVEE